MKDEKGSQGVAFIMNKFFRKWHYEYLLEQMCEIGLESRVGIAVSGTQQEKEKAPISMRKDKG